MIFNNLQTACNKGFTLWFFDCRLAEGIAFKTISKKKRIFSEVNIIYHLHSRTIEMMLFLLEFAVDIVHF